MSNDPERQFDSRDERRLVSEMAAALEGKPVVLLTLWESTAVVTAKLGEGGEPKVMAHVKGRINKTDIEVDFELLVDPESAATIAHGMSVALQRLAGFPENGTFFEVG